MKKIFVTLLTAALISGGAYAQETSDTTQIRKDAEQAEDQTEDAMERTEEDMKQKADETSNDAVQDDDGTATEKQKPAGEGMGTSDEGVAVAPSYGPMVEVIENKEGPNHEVVYKVNGELFYVDREQKQLVKTEESNLHDAKDAPVIHSPMKK